MPPIVTDHSSFGTLFGNSDTRACSRGVCRLFWVLVFSFFVLVVIVPTVCALIDVLSNNFKGTDKLVWLFVLVFIPLVGVLLYYAIGRHQKV